MDDLEQQLTGMVKKFQRLKAGNREQRLLAIFAKYGLVLPKSSNTKKYNEPPPEPTAQGNALNMQQLIAERLAKCGLLEQ